MKKMSVILICFVIFLSSAILIAQTVEIYYPTPFDYPDPNVMKDDLHLANYYGRDISGSGSATTVSTDDGVSGTANVDAEANPFGVFDKIFGEDSSEIKGDDFVRAYSKVKFVNTVPDTPKANVWLDGYLLSDTLGYARATESLEIQPGRVPFEVHIIGAPSVVGEMNLEAGKEHIAFITGLKSVSSDSSSPYYAQYGISVVVVRENPIMDRTKAGVNFFNAAPIFKLDGIDMRLGTNANNLSGMFFGKTFKEYAGTQELVPGSYVIDVVSGTKTLTKPLNVELQAGKKYYVIAFAPYGFNGLTTTTTTSSNDDIFVYEE